MADIDGRTPLSWTANHGHYGVVKILLGWKDVDPNIADGGGRTPLSWAADYGYNEVVQLLLGRTGSCQPQYPRP